MSKQHVYYCLYKYSDKKHIMFNKRIYDIIDTMVGINNTSIPIFLPCLVINISTLGILFIMIAGLN